MKVSKAPEPFAAIRWPQESERLLLRPAMPSDAEATWVYRKLPQVTQWITSAWDNLADYRESFLIPERLQTRLVVEHEGRVIGEVMVQPVDAWVQREVSELGKDKEAELGWAFDPQVSGHGLASEAISRVINLCFTDLGLLRVTARCFADNEPSWRLMERLGMRRETHLIAAALHRELGWLDGYGYGLRADEWVNNTPK
ncbi:GNAT family N-acetyltransferase [Arthrobacter sp. MYb227]|uniref:GNAT family N-acetyltransferase n=1 Tax=Arthrobacter sp. MYb227 TaxID=1848601 RepID=UPI000CFD9298|nr:GNAT family N-acetyltransferase [Arthrobacter sp. MYb227]PQZ87769.1 GNAT family N-acetyltransferase [Arthrobacter sp. MYb227]